MTITIDGLDDLTLDVAWRVGFDACGVTFSDATVERMRRGRAAFERYLESDRTQFVYGTTTAPGGRAKTRIGTPDQDSQGQTLWTYVPRCAGTGGKFLPERTVRLIVLARLVNFVGTSGHVRPETARWVAGLLNGPMPAVPFASATGPGEVMPLSHLYQSLEEIPLAPGEAMDLVNGSPCATAMVAEAALTARRRLRLAERVFALAIEGANAPLDHYDPALKALTADPDHRLALDRIAALLADTPNTVRLPHQAPVSWRIWPTVLATAIHAMRRAERVAMHSLRSVADNPVFVEPSREHAQGRALSTGGFHNHQAGRAIDGLNAAWADLCVLGAKQASRLLDGTPFGLPPFLVLEGSGVVGTEFFAWMQNSHAERAGQAAAPAVLSLGIEDPVGGQSDVASRGFIAYERHLEASDALDASLAVLAVVASQALFVSSRGPAPALREFHERIVHLAPPITGETIRDLGPALQRLRAQFTDVVLGRDKENERALLGDLEHDSP